MARTTVAVTLNTRTLRRIDRLVRDERFSNRSQAIEATVNGQLDRLEHRRLAEHPSFPRMRLVIIAAN